MWANDPTMIMDPRAAVQPGAGQPAMSDEPEEIKSLRRVRVELVMNTAHPSPQDFRIEALEEWLRNHKTREGVPYTIVATEEPWRFERLTARAAGAAANQNTGGFRPGPRAGIPAGREPFNEFINEPGGRSPIGNPTPTAGDDVGRPDVDIDRLAPVNPQEGDVPQFTGQYVLVFYAVLDPMPAGAGGEQ
jgi:hypothetical protein